MEAAVVKKIGLDLSQRLCPSVRHIISKTYDVSATSCFNWNRFEPATIQYIKIITLKYWKERKGKSCKLNWARNDPVPQLGSAQSATNGPPIIAIIS
jgi:hypothetical protein